MSVYCSVTKLCPTLFDPMDCSPPGFPRQEYWSGVTLPSPGDLPDPGIKPMSFALAGIFCITELPGKPCVYSFFEVF